MDWGNIINIFLFCSFFLLIVGYLTYRTKQLKIGFALVAIIGFLSLQLMSIYGLKDNINIKKNDIVKIVN